MGTNGLPQTASQSGNQDNKIVLTCEIEEEVAAAFKAYCAKQGKTEAAVLKDYVLRLGQSDNEANEELTVNRSCCRYGAPLTEDDQLQEKVYSFAHLFGDLIFEEGTETYPFSCYNLLLCPYEVLRTDKYDQTIYITDIVIAEQNWQPNDRFNLGKSHRRELRSHWPHR